MCRLDPTGRLYLLLIKATVGYKTRDGFNDHYKTPFELFPFKNITVCCRFLYRSSLFCVNGIFFFFFFVSFLHLVSLVFGNRVLTKTAQRAFIHEKRSVSITSDFKNPKLSFCQSIGKHSICADIFKHWRKHSGFCDTTSRSSLIYKGFTKHSSTIIAQLINACEHKNETNDVICNIGSYWEFYERRLARMMLYYNK